MAHPAWDCQLSGSLACPRGPDLGAEGRLTVRELGGAELRNSFSGLQQFYKESKI